MKSPLALFAWSIVIIAILPHLCSAEENPLYAELVERGLAVGGQQLPLTKPTLPDGLDAAAQRAALAPLSTSSHPLEAIVRNSVVAPVVVDLDKQSLGPGATSTLRKLDSWFVVYAPLDKLSDEMFLKGQFDTELKTSDPDEVMRLEELPLASLGPIGAAADSRHEKYFYARVRLFERVQIGSTLRSWCSRTDESLTVALVLDTRFERDAQHPNVWQSIERRGTKSSLSAETHSLPGVGGYVKATRLHEPAGAVLVETHLVFEEPRGWFNGANLLASKLPMLSQDGARKFRRRVVDDTAQAASAPHRR
jgi:hypothetical protein